MNKEYFTVRGLQDDRTHVRFRGTLDTISLCGQRGATPGQGKVNCPECLSWIEEKEAEYKAELERLRIMRTKGE